MDNRRVHLIGTSSQFYKSTVQSIQPSPYVLSFWVSWEGLIYNLVKGVKQVLRLLIHYFVSFVYEKHKDFVLMYDIF